MKNVATGILCSVLCALTACGGGGSSSGSKPKSSSSVALSSSSVAVSSAALSSTPVSSSSVVVSSVAPSSAPASSVASTASSEASSQAVSSSAASVESSSSSSSTPVALTGVFVDSAVAGIAYETSPSGFTGFTSVTGQYQYAEGDTVVFSIGVISLPAVTAKGVVTPVDMKGTGTDQVVTNIAVLLQSLDADGDASNGISIPSAAASVATSPVTFDQPYADFASAVLPVVQHSDSNKSVVLEAAAVAHLEESLADIKAKSLIGTWYVEGDSYKYVLFILDESHYASVDSDSAEGNGEAFATGNYVWDQVSGKVTLSNLRRTDSDLDARPPMAEGNTFVVDGNKLTVSDDGSYDGEEATFELTRLIPSEESPLKGGWFIGDEVVFAFTDTHYFMGQYSEPEEDNSGYPGMEMGTYNYNSSTKAITYSTLVDSNGQWGLSHPCAIISDNEHPQYEGSNFFNCGPNGAAVLQTMEVTGDTLTFISEADTINNGGDEEPVPMERVVDGVPDGDIHLKLELTLTLTEYEQGQLFNPEGATMQCDLNQAPTVDETETLWESWVIGGASDRKNWISSEEATYNPETGELTLDMHEEWARIPGHPGFWESWTDTVDLTYQPGQENVIVGTVTEVNNLSWDRNREQVSTCTSTYTVVGKLRPVAESQE